MWREERKCQRHVLQLTWAVLLLARLALLLLPATLALLLLLATLPARPAQRVLATASAGKLPTCRMHNAVSLSTEGNGKFDCRQVTTWKGVQSFNFFAGGGHKNRHSYVSMVHTSREQGKPHIPGSQGRFQGSNSWWNEGATAKARGQLAASLVKVK